MKFRVYRPQMGHMVAVGPAYCDFLRAKTRARHYQGEVRVWGTSEVIFTTYGNIRPGLAQGMRTPGCIGQTLQQADVQVRKAQTLAQPAKQLHPRIVQDSYSRTPTVRVWRADK